MPLITVASWADRFNKDQRTRLTQAITDAAVTILHTNPQAVTILFDDLPKDQWANAGVLASDSPTWPPQVPPATE